MASKGHEYLKELLKKMFPLADIEEEYPIKVRGKTLYIDILMKSPIRVAFEMQGIQHEQFSPFFHKSADDLRLQQINDNLKRMWCAENKIGLVYVWYDEEVGEEELRQRILDAVNDVQD